MKIETNLIPLVFEEPPDGVILKERHAETRRDVGSEALAQAVYTLAFGVPAGILSAWLYDKIRSYKDKSGFRFRVNSREITEFTESSFKQTIEREIEMEIK